MRVKLHKRVHKFLKKQSLKTALQIKKRLLLLRNNPFRYLESLEQTDSLKLRIGEYRALVDVFPDRELVFVRVIDHRKRFYKR